MTQARPQLGVAQASLARILDGHKGTSADIALGLAALLGTSTDMWLGMQRPMACGKPHNSPGSRLSAWLWWFKAADVHKKAIF